MKIHIRSLYLSLGILFLVFTSQAQLRHYTVFGKEGTKYSKVVLLSLNEDTLVMANVNRTFRVQVNALHEVYELKGASGSTGVVVGGLIGAAIGVGIGDGKDKKDAREHFSPSPGYSNKILYGLAGLCGAALIGSIIERSVSEGDGAIYDMRGMNDDEKKALLRELVVTSNIQQFPPQPTTSKLMDLKTEEDDFKQTPEPKAENILVLLHAGAGMPVGEFGSDDRNSASSGYAATGFEAGADLLLPMKRDLFTDISISYTYHKYDIDIPTGITSSGWSTISPMIGFYRIFNRERLTSFYGKIAIGVMIGGCPSLDGFINGVHINQSSDYAPSFAFSAGVGFLVDKKIAIGIQYLYAKPEFEITLTIDNSYGTGKVKQSMGIVLLTMGLLLSE